MGGKMDFRSFQIRNDVGHPKWYLRYLKNGYIIAAPLCTPINCYIVIIVIGEIMWKNTDSKLVLAVKEVKAHDDTAGCISS